MIKFRVKSVCSPVLQAFIDKAQIQGLLMELEVGQSVDIENSTFTGEEMRQWCDSWSVGTKRFVYLNHGVDGQEVCRIPDNVETSLFYVKPKHKTGRVLTGTSTSDDDLKALVWKAVESYMAIDEQMLSVYTNDCTLRGRNVIPRAYLMRKMYTFKAFKVAPNKVELLDYAIGLVLKDGMYPLLLQVLKNIALSEFNSNAVLYFMNHNTLAKGVDR